MTGPSSAVPRYLSALFQSGTPVALSDVELLERFASRQGAHDETSELAFAALLARHGPMVLRVCRAVLGDRHEVEDAFQATFLVLAVRAGSIRRRQSVASWLHGVASRVSASERSRAARRRRHERRRAVMTASTTEQAGTGPVHEHELSSVIQEEVGHLPEKYRAVVVLCYLEGLTHEMAADQLGWPVGSVRSRLAWARDRLRGRLTRRGIAPAAIPFVRTGSATDPESVPSPCIVPATLVDTTLRGALSTGLGQGTVAGIVSAEAVALMKGAVKSMTTAMLIIVTAAILIVGLVTAGAGVLAHFPPRQAIPPIAQSSPRPGGAAPAKAQAPVVIQALVVDSQGHTLPGVDVFVTIAYARPMESPEWVPERAVSDQGGRVRVEIARERVDGQVSGANLWAYQRGRAVATSGFSLQRTVSPPVTRIVLEQPVKRTITVLGPDGRPIDGLRLAPRSVRRGNSRFPTSIPEELLERLTVTTDANGEATLPYLPQDMEPLVVQVSGPGIAAHALKVSDVPRKRTVKIGRTGRLVGIVRGESGAPVAGIPVAVWVRTAGTLPSGMQELNSLPEMIRFDSQRLTTGAQGAFQTPSTLLNGSTYRVTIQQHGFAPFVSEWVTLSGERSTIPAIRLQSLRKLAGQVHDRQGQPVGGARVFLPAGGPSTVTDAQGRFELRDLLPDKTLVLVEQRGFRFQGWIADPATQDGELRLTLVRASEAPDRSMRALAEPIPDDEARALANRVLEPFLQAALEKGSDLEKRAALVALSTFDLDRALELFKKSPIQSERTSSSVRVELARRLAVKDPAGAEALIEPISDPMRRAEGVLTLARAVPASRREQKRQLLEKAAALVPGMPNSAARIRQIAAIAEAWLDLGEVEKARLLIQDNLKLFDASPLNQRGIPFLFLAQFSRLEPEQALARIQKLTSPATRDACLAEAATQLALDHPAEAERFFHLREGRDVLSISGTLRLCRRLARVDPPRARRVAASLRGPGERVCAWAFVALGQAEKDRPGALEALDHAIEEMDRLRESGPGPNPGIVVVETRMIYPTNPAALILPVVERIAPERLAEVFWRAVALHPRLDTTRQDLLRSSYIGVECMLLARYDREAASVLFEPMDSYLQSLVARRSESGEWTSSVIVAKACLDPRAAVALLENLPAPRRGPFTRPAYEARIDLAEALGPPPDERWKTRWSHLYYRELPLDD